MRILFLGTPGFAVPTLEKLISWSGCQVVGVVAQPDRPAGRGNKMHPPPTKVLAEKHAIPVLQPERLSRAPEVVEQMQALKPDVLVMVAFGQILKKAVLEMAPLGVVNLHGSLLPKYRGPAPINWAIINGETITGATTMFSDKGVDTGAMLLQQEIAITPNMTSVQLAEKMSLEGAELVIKTLEGIVNGSVQPQVQDESQATYAPLLTREMGEIDWSKPAEQIHNLVRGLQPWPGTSTTYNGAALKVVSTRLPQKNNGGNEVYPAGSIVLSGGEVFVCCGDGSQRLELADVQPANKARMSARDWANGVRLTSGSKLGIKPE